MKRQYNEVFSVNKNEFLNPKIVLDIKKDFLISDTLREFYEAQILYFYIGRA